MVWGPMLDNPQGQKLFSVAGVPLSEPVPAADPHRRHCAEPRRRRQHPFSSSVGKCISGRLAGPDTLNDWSLEQWRIQYYYDHEMIPGWMTSQDE